MSNFNLKLTWCLNQEEMRQLNLLLIPKWRMRIPVKKKNWMVRKVTSPMMENLTKSIRRCRRQKVCETQMIQELEKLSKGARSDTVRKTKRPKWTRHQKWELTKFGHEDKIKEKKDEMGLTIKKSFKTINTLLYRTQCALWEHVRVKIRERWRTREVTRPNLGNFPVVPEWVHDERIQEKRSRISAYLPYLPRQEAHVNLCTLFHISTWADEHIPALHSLPEG